MSAPISLEEILAEIDPDLARADEEESEAKSSKKSLTKTRKNNKTSDVWIEEEDSEDEVLDLLGPNAAQAIMSKKPVQKKNVKKEDEKTPEENGGFAIDPATGKLLITEEHEKHDDGMFHFQKILSFFSFFFPFSFFSCWV